MNKIAVFDCDDVLANMREVLVERIGNLLNRKVSVDEFDTYDLNNVYGRHPQFDEGAVFRDIPLEQLNPEPGAAMLTHYLKCTGWKIAMVTARGNLPNGRQRTIDWLNRHNIIVDDLHVVTVYDGKRAALESLGDIAFYVEDNHQHVEIAHTLPNIHDIYLMDRPWNKQTTVGTRVNSLDAVFQHIISQPQES
jgi:5'(3')-deoxyribonucleotidase